MFDGPLEFGDAIETRGKKGFHKISAYAAVFGFRSEGPDLVSNYLEPLAEFFAFAVESIFLRSYVNSYGRGFSALGYLLEVLFERFEYASDSNRDRSGSGWKSFRTVLDMPGKEYRVDPGKSCLEGIHGKSLLHPFRDRIFQRFALQEYPRYPIIA